MPISRYVVFVCTKCGYKEVRRIGDVRPDLNELKPCPKCGGMMEATREKPDAFGLMLGKMREVFG